MNVKKMNDEIVVENRVEDTLLNINEKISGSYSSSNSAKLNSNNGKIADVVHTKASNLKSFKAYTEKYINIYTNASVEAADAAANVSRSYSGN